MSNVSVPHAPTRQRWKRPRLRRLLSVFEYFSWIGALAFRRVSTVVLAGFVCSIVDSWVHLLCRRKAAIYHAVVFLSRIKKNMKFIQTLISDGMSMNSLKPSINTEAESSLDTCIMKETPVDDCILTKERNSQNNGDKELCLTDYEMGNVENTAKKMFEQVDLNSSMPNSEVSLKKDSWNTEALYDNSSEKENIELNDVRYDILSDEDDNESIHLKISSDDDNSVTESETNEPNSVCNKQLDNSNDNLSQNVTEDGENPNSPSEVHNDLQNESNCASFDGYEIEGRIAVGDSEHEDIPEDFESMPSCSDSLKHNVNDSITSDTMVNEAISPPYSLENSPSVEKDLDPVNANSENVIKENTAKEDTELLPIDPQDESKHDSSPDLLSTDSEMKDLLPGNSTSEEKNISIKDNEDNLSSANDADSVEVPEKEVNSLSGVNDSDSCVGQSEENGLKINDAPKSGEGSSNECIEEEEEEEKQLPNRAFDEVHSEPKEDESSESDDSGKDRTSLNESSPQSDVKSLEETSPLKESTDSEEKFLEILEYQPANEEVEELREIQPDKDILGDEIQQEMSDEIEQEQQSESHAEKELESNNSPSMVPKDVECSSPKSDAETSPFSSPQSNSTQAEITNNSEGSKEKDGDTKESDDNDNEEDAKRDKLSEVASCSEVIDTETISDDREDLGDVECVSEVVSAKKQVLPEISEAQSGRKRTSSNEENLVNCSKRTKVAVSESENQTSDVLMSELPTDSDSRKKCSEADTKEKCDSRTKRLSNSVDDAVQIKKIRVMPEVSISDKDEKLDKQANSSVSLETKKSSENNTDARKEASNLGKHPMPFLRTLNRAQFQNMSRNDLEELILQKMCEAVTQRSKCGELRELAQTLEEKLKTWQKKCVQLTKQVKDLNVVLKRYGSDLQSKGPGAIPVRITRSVGLQVQMPGISGSSWNAEESTKRKSEKTPPPTPTSSVSTSGTNSSKASSPVAKPTSTAVQKVSDGSDVQASTASTRLNTPTTHVGGIKALQTKPPASANSPATPNKTGKAQPPVNRVKSDHQVIDLTDGEDKTKNTTTRLPVVSSSPATTVSVPTVSTTVTSSVSNTAVATMSIPANRSIRVVQQLGTSSTPIIAQSAANAVAGQRVAYFVPSTSVPVQPRQLIISSPSQVRPAGVASMSQRQNPLPTIVLKPGQVVPVSSVAGGGNIIRTSSIGSSLQLTRQPRTGQLIQRFPINANSVQSTGLSVVQSSGLTVSSVSHPAPLPPVPSGPSNANWKLPPPKPDLKISKVPNRNQQGIVLSWNMTVSNDHEQIASYQLFAYQEGNAPPSTHLWKKVGDVTALPLPMACTLTQFMEGHKYHFAVRAVDVFARCGPFSAPGNIVLSRH